MEMREEENLKLSIVMPCRNEEKTVALSVNEAKEFIEKYNIAGEILVVDNDSDDASAVNAAKEGARVISEKNRGYGYALRTGIAHSRGSVIIMGDCDMTYDFRHLEEMYRLLSENQCDMVIGNRYTGGMETGSMPWSHKWGVKMLSCLARIRFHTHVYDFHCGLRGITSNAAKQLDFHTGGMEFATEMIAEAAKNQLIIKEVPVKLKTCKFVRESKLRTIQDGFRHLGYIIKKRG